jgi:hypothetical protein
MLLTGFALITKPGYLPSVYSWGGGGTTLPPSYAVKASPSFSYTGGVSDHTWEWWKLGVNLTGHTCWGAWDRDERIPSKVKLSNMHLDA